MYIYIINMKVWVVSPGGVGCTNIIGTLNKNGIETNHMDDADRIKHLCSPETEVYKKTVKKFDKIVYVYNDPLLSILSHYRRRWSHAQHKKICAQLLSISELGKTISAWEVNTIRKKKDILEFTSIFRIGLKNIHIVH